MSMEDYNFAKAREAWATPVKIVQYNCTCGKTMKFESAHGVIAPQREWVGLTLADKEEYLALDFGGNRLDAMDWANRRLKEKNT